MSPGFALVCAKKRSMNALALKMVGAFLYGPLMRRRTQSLFQNELSCFNELCSCYPTATIITRVKPIEPRAVSHSEANFKSLNSLQTL